MPKEIDHPFLRGRYEGPPFADAAGFLFVSPKGKILILKRAGKSKWAGRWASAGGRLDEGETPLRAAVRETIEEIGALPKYCKLTNMVKLYWMGVLYCTWIVFTPIEFPPRKLDKREHSQWRWVTPEEIESGRYQLHDGFAETLKLAMPEVFDK